MGPHSGLSLRGGTGYPAPHWNLELGTWTPVVKNAVMCITGLRGWDSKVKIFNA